MTRDETARKLKQALNEHVKDVKPSSQALFAINRRIRDTDQPFRERFRPLRRLKPSYVFGGLTLLLLGLFTGTLISQTTPASDLQVAVPTTQTTVQDTSSIETVACPSDFSDESGYVNIYFYCAGELIPRKRPTNDASLTSALQLLVAGPTQTELEIGFSSELLSTTGNLLNEVNLADYQAVIDFSEQLPQSRQILEQINRTVFGFDDVLLVEYSINGECNSIAETNPAHTCHSYTRDGARPGNTNLKVVFFEEIQIGNRTLYSCTNGDSCQDLGEVDATQQFKYTGGKETNSSRNWIELITPDGRIGWIDSKGASIQPADEISAASLYLIVQKISNLTTNRNPILHEVFSAEGVYISYVTPTGGIYGRSHIADPTAEIFKETVDQILSLYADISGDESIAATPSPLLENLQHISLRSTDNNINTYFDFRNGYPEIIAISIYPDS